MPPFCDTRHITRTGRSLGLPSLHSPYPKNCRYSLHDWNEGLRKSLRFQRAAVWHVICAASLPPRERLQKIRGGIAMRLLMARLFGMAVFTLSIIPTAGATLIVDAGQCDTDPARAIATNGLVTA